MSPTRSHRGGARVRDAAPARARRRPRRAARAPRTSAPSGCARASCPTSSPRRAACARATGACRPRLPTSQDRRVEITGPVDREDGDQRAELRREGLHGRLRGRELADLGERDRGPGEPLPRDRPHDSILEPGGQGLPAERRGRDAARAPARLAPASSATSRSTARRSRRACSTSASTCSATTRGSLRPARGPYFYLPKLESHREARAVERRRSSSRKDALGIPRGTIRATVLIETILAAFEMDEILHELGPHATGLNAGRWDYIFSVIKKLGHRPEFVLPDRGDGDDGRAVHALLRGAARPHVPPPRRARDRRHGGVHPLAARRRGERGRAREGARGQGARGGAGLRRHLGRAPRPRAGRDGDLRPRARRAAEPARGAARGRRARRGRRCSTSPRRRARSPRPACATTSRSGSSTSPPGSAARAPSRSST